MSKERVQKFYSRWGIQSSDEAEFSKLKNRILSVLQGIFGRSDVDNINIVNRFALIDGSHIEAYSPISFALRTSFLNSIEKTPLYMAFSEASTEKELVLSLQNLFWTLEEISKADLIDQTYKSIQYVINRSFCTFTLLRRDKRVYVIPAGAKELDEALVKDTLTWLGDPPSARKAFEQALEIYQHKDEAKYRNLIDNLRVSIEQVLRRILKNRKSLENQKDVLLKWLDQKCVHAQIRNLYNQLLFGPYSILQNDSAKHGDEKLSEIEIEYLIYLTGTFLRFLIQLEQAQDQLTEQSSDNRV
jgi:hypothetical protein